MAERYRINLKTRDGAALAFDCGAEENLLDAAAEAGIHLPSSCRSGGCGACAGTCQDGAYELGDHTADALSEDAKAQGQILTCRTYPRGDMTIQVEADEAHLTAGPVQSWTAAIVELEDLGGQVRRLVLQAEAGENGLPAFEPGQFMELEVPGQGVSRAYSLSNGPNWDGILEFLIRLQPGGVCSGWLKDEAAVGQKLQVRGPMGAFVLNEGSLNPRFFIAGGTGLAPMLSMLRQMADYQEVNRVFLYLGVNREEDLFGRRMVADLQAELDQLKFTPCVWQAGDGWDGYTGTPVAAAKADMAAEIARGVSPEVYLCGPPGLVDAATQAAKDLGIQDDLIFSEKFLPS